MTDREQPQNQLITTDSVSQFLDTDRSPELVTQLENLIADTRKIRDPSRNWNGLQLMKQLSKNEIPLTDTEKSKILIISCDNETDSVGQSTGIETISLSPNSMSPDSFESASLVNSEDLPESSEDPLLDHIIGGEKVFKLTIEAIEMLRQKELILFVGKDRKGSHLFKFESFVDNALMKHLIDTKYTFFAIGSFSAESGRVQYDDFATDECVKDINDFGQDFWAPQ